MKASDGKTCSIEFKDSDFPPRGTGYNGPNPTVRPVTQEQVVPAGSRSESINSAAPLALQVPPPPPSHPTYPQNISQHPSAAIDDDIVFDQFDDDFGFGDFDEDSAFDEDFGLDGDVDLEEVNAVMEVEARYSALQKIEETDSSGTSTPALQAVAVQRSSASMSVSDIAVATKSESKIEVVEEIGVGASQPTSPNGESESKIAAVEEIGVGTSRPTSPNGERPLEGRGEKIMNALLIY